MTYVDEDGNFVTDYSIPETNSDIITDDSVDNSGSEDIQENQAEEIQDNSNDDFFKDVIKMLIQDKTTDSENDDDLENDDVEHGGSSGEVPELVPDPRNELQEDVTSGNAIDYSGLLGDIISRQDAVIENQEYLIAVSDDNNINSTLESQTATNVLLMVVIVILLVNILVKFVRGLF